MSGVAAEESDTGSSWLSECVGGAKTEDRYGYVIASRPEALVRIEAVAVDEAGASSGIIPRFKKIILFKI